MLFCMLWIYDRLRTDTLLFCRVCVYTKTSTVTLYNISCIDVNNCNTECLNVYYQVDCVNYTATYNITGQWREYQPVSM